MEFEWGTMIFQLFSIVFFLLILVGIPLLIYRIVHKKNNNVGELKRRIEVLEKEMNKHK